VAQNRYYTSDATATTLAASLGAVTPGSTGQTVEVASITDWPTSYPFTTLIDWGNGSQEVATMTQAATGSGPYTFANCIRGDDGSLSPSHSNGATIVHGVSARDFNEPQEHINGFTQGMAPSGITGATAVSRYVGGVTGAHPSTGTFQVGDWAADRDGGFWTCTAAGSPGTWVQTSGTGGGGGTVDSVTATDTSIVVSGSGTNPTIATGTLDVIATQHPPAASVPMNSHKFTGLANGSGSTDSVAYGQLGTAAFQASSAFDASGAAATAQANAEAASLPIAGGTMTGYMAPAVVTLTFGTTMAVNADLGNVFKVTLTASTGTIENPTNPVDGQILRFRVIQDSTGNRSVAWGTAFDWGSGNSAPSLSTAASVTDVLGFEYNAASSKWMYLGASFPQAF
jgi:hypothetical protein